MTVGSKSTNTARGTCFPAPVSLKNVLKESSPPPIVLSLGIWPSGWIPCSKQYNSQQALPIWTPAWPTWIEIHSRYDSTRNGTTSQQWWSWNETSKCVIAMAFYHCSSLIRKRKGSVKRRTELWIEASEDSIRSSVLLHEAFEKKAITYVPREHKIK